MTTAQCNDPMDIVPPIDISTYPEDVINPKLKWQSIQRTKHNDDSFSFLYIGESGQRIIMGSFPVRYVVVILLSLIWYHLSVYFNLLSSLSGNSSDGSSSIDYAMTVSESMSPSTAPISTDNSHTSDDPRMSDVNQVVTIQVKPTTAATISTTDTTTAKITQDNQGHPFRICRATAEKNIDYRCTGTEYDDFGRRFQAYLNETRQLERNATRIKKTSTKKTRVNPNWGRRTFPFPSNTTVLLMGNSHTRQIGDELLCQYTDQIVSHDKLVPTIAAEVSDNIPNQTATFLSNFGLDNMGHYSKTVFSNGVTFVHISNSYIIYTENCCGENGLLEHVIGMPLSKVSAILLGKFNVFENSKSSYFRTVLRENWNILLEKSPPIELEQLASVYDGPIIAYSMFAEYANEFGNETEKKVQEMRAGYADTHSAKNMARNGTSNATITQEPRDNLRFVNVRAHVDRLGECSSSARKSHVGKCMNNNPDGHRCVGIHGGHPTLAVWDLLESIHDVD